MTTLPKTDEEVRTWYYERARDARRKMEELDARGVIPGEGDEFYEVEASTWDFMPGHKVRSLTVTRQQANRIRQILADLLEGERTELKSLDFSIVGRKLAMSVETGMSGDEGTMASILCRDRLLIFVGPRGGLSATGRKKVGGKRVRLTGWKAVIYGRESGL